MNLHEFRADMVQAVTNFVLDYEKDRQTRNQTQVREASEWLQMFDEYIEHRTDFSGIRTCMCCGCSAELERLA